MALGLKQRGLELPGLGGELSSGILPFAQSFQCFQNFAGAFQHRVRDARQLCHLDTVAFIRTPGHDLAEPDDMVALLFHGYSEVLHTGQRLFELIEVVIVRGEERLCPDRVQVFRDRPGQCQAIVSAGAAPDLIQNHQGARRGIVQNIRGLVHLHHERALAACQVVVRSDPRKDAVDEANGGRIGGNKGADLCQQHDQCHLTEIGAFPCRIGAGNNVEAMILAV